MPAPSQSARLENGGQMQAGLGNHGFQRAGLFGLREVGEDLAMGEREVGWYKQSFLLIEGRMRANGAERSCEL